MLTPRYATLGLIGEVKNFPDLPGKFFQDEGFLDEPITATV
jgi:hypothetical protein